MLKVLNTLRSKSLTDAQNLLDRLRASQNTASFARNFRPIRSAETLDSPAASSSNRSSESVQRRPSSSDALSDTSSTTTSPDWEEASEKHSWQHDPETAPRLLPAGFELPSEHLIREAVQRFYSSSGKLFHIFSQQEIQLSIDRLFQAEGNDLTRLMLCRLCCVAAAGVLYMKDQPSGEEDVLYNIARMTLDDAIQDSPLEAAKCCTLLGLYNIMSKATVALAYLELGIDLSRRYQVHSTSVSRPRDSLTDEWSDGRKAWRTLLFLGWYVCLEPADQHHP